ncbi:alpha/beta hydrolase [Citrobacter koseri]|uniref:alpha/beta hydrolase n=1 Tax=Citrobacter koseri TaxID=545 RepID=UPI0028BEDDBF|nr:alpha/beta hydrolase [Citrobacter koseri]MDT7485739.1 alpha/beta hydrolase [Citrobacter koseri]
MYGREYRNGRRRMAPFLAISCITLLYGAKGYARPDMEPLGPNIADRGSAFYHFRVENFDSADGKRHYKVWTGIPDKTPPASGYPVLYMLDGNAVMDRLTEDLLKQLAEKTPPVIVAIGYQTHLPFDLNGRAYDYTPALEVKSGAEGRYRRPGGGSGDFRRLLETRIAPQTEQGLNIDPERRGVWGHSYGGLFVLDSWLSSSFFRFYYSASPSLGRDNSSLLTRLTTMDVAKNCHKRLFFMEGSASPGKNAQTPVSDILNKTRAAVSALQKDGLAVAWWNYPGLTHGPMFTASFQSALLNMSAEETPGAARCD